MRTAIRFCVLGLSALSTGCSMLDWIDSAGPDQFFKRKPVIAITRPPVYRVGDTYHFQIAGEPISETVEQIDDQGVWWRNSFGHRWIGTAGTLVPSRTVVKSNDTLKILESRIEKTGDLFPLKSGKTVTYSYAVQGEKRTARMHERSCVVGSFGAVKTAAGPFDAYRVRCSYDGIVRINYYAPSLGLVVMQTSERVFRWNSIFLTVSDPTRRELVGIERGPPTPVRSAKSETKMPATPADTSALPARSAKSETKMLAAPASGMRYGVQLAAYRSPARARQSWSRLKRAGGALLDGQSPAIERYIGKRGTLFQLIVGVHATMNEARAYCRALKNVGMDCWPRARVAANSTPIAGRARR